MCWPQRYLHVTVDTRLMFTGNTFVGSSILTCRVFANLFCWHQIQRACGLPTSHMWRLPRSTSRLPATVQIAVIFTSSHGQTFSLGSPESRKKLWKDLHCSFLASSFILNFLVYDLYSFFIYLFNIGRGLIPIDMETADFSYIFLWMCNDKHGNHLVKHCLNSHYMLSNSQKIARGQTWLS